MYKIRAANAICGIPSPSAWSEEKKLVSGEPPVKPDVPTVCIEDTSDTAADPYTEDRLRCQTGTGTRLRASLRAAADVTPRVIIEWDRSPVGETIIEYEVSILNGAGNFAQHPDCDVAAALAMEQADDSPTPTVKPKCAISMESFWSGEFQMDQGHFITSTVRAKNNKGWSVASTWNTAGGKVEKVPSMMNPPAGERQTLTNDVALQWTKMVAPRDGGSEIITYILKYTTFANIDGDWTTLLGDENDEATFRTAD